MRTIASTPNPYKRFLVRRLNTKGDLTVSYGHFDVSRDDWKLFRKDPTLLLMLCSLTNYGQTKAGEDGWFLCTPRFIEQGTGFGDKEGTEILNGLVDLELLEIKHVEGKRHVRVLFDTWERMIKERKERGAVKKAQMKAARERKKLLGN